MIYFFQPAAPKYRIPFYDKLSESCDINVFVAREDFLGVKSELHPEYIKLAGEFIGFFGAYWHKGVPFSIFMKNDIVVISGNPRILNYMLLLLFCRLRGIKTVWWGQGWTAGKRGVFAQLRRKIMHLADVVLLYTDKEVKEFGGGKKIHALNNGIDTENIPRAKLNVDKYHQCSSLNLLFIGRLTKKANMQFLLKALSRLEREYLLHVVGSGEELSALQMLAADLNLSDSVIWHGEVFDEVKISEIASFSHAFIYPGAVGLSLIHAFAHSLPAIVNKDDKYHMPEFAAFEEGYNGLGYCGEDDLVSLLNSLEISDLLVMSGNARNAVELSYNTSDMADRFLKYCDIKPLNPHR
jgi:glycosyltransferase involved in cell wall biosynthesis